MIKIKFNKKVKIIILVLGIIFALATINNHNLNVVQVNDEKSLEENTKTQLRSASYDWNPQITRSVGNTPKSVFIGDANNDGHNDIVTSNNFDDNVSILLWNAISGDWDPQITRSVGDAPYSVFIGDPNNDGYNDIVTANIGDDDISIILWNATSGDWDPQITRSVGSYPWSVFIGDPNNDGLNDIVTANYWDDDISIILWNATSGDWDPQITRSVGDSPRSVSIGDPNNDGLNDIVTANYQDDNVSILLWNATSGDWDPQITRSVGNEPASVFIGDANNDGLNDIVTANQNDKNVSILLWNDTLSDWYPQFTRSVGNTPNSVFIGDANNDAWNDIVTTNILDDNVSILLWNDTLSDWDPQFTRSVGTLPLSVLIGDANNDAWNDIVTANSDDNNVSILLWNAPPPTITINTPENITYTEPMSGYYPGTYGFECDAVGTTGTDISFVDVYGHTVEVIEELEGHKHILKIQRLAHWASASNNFINQTSGTIEFWAQADDAYQKQVFVLNDDGIAVLQFNIDGGYFKWIDKDLVWHDIKPCSDNTWYHLKIVFRSDNTFDWYIDDVLEVDNQDTYKDMTNGIDQIHFKEFDGHAGWLIDAVGYSWDPNYEIGDNMEEGLLLSFEKNTFLDWMGYSLDDQANRAILGNKTFPMPDDGPHTVQVFGNTSIGFMVQSDIKHFSIDTKVPEIDINMPIQNKIFGITAPGFYISINETNLVSTWYTIDSGLTNFTFTGFFGYIDQNAWTKAPNGQITITFYAKDIADNEGAKGVTVIKDVVKLLSVDLIDQSFSTEEFNLTFSVYNETGQGINFATIQMWWNSTDVSASVQNLGEGLYQVSLNPIFVESGEDPILLNMTISASGYTDKYFETYLAVEPCDVSNLLYVEIVDQFFSTEEFYITFSVYNATGQGIDFTTIQVWWDGIDVSTNVVNLGSGLFNISLTPITVAPDEDPILLNMTISASGYNEKYFETYLAVEPCTVSNLLYVEIIDQSFSTEEFDINFYIYNGFGQAIDFATLQMWWNGTDVSASVQNLGSGLFSISLTPISVAPGDDPILLNMTISASGYNEKYFEADFAVDPETLEKSIEEGPPLALIIAIIASISGGGAVVIITTALLYRKRRKKIE